MLTCEKVIKCVFDHGKFGKFQNRLHRNYLVAPIV